MPAESTQVAIIGAGPAGLLLGQLLAQQGIDNVILEKASAEHVQGRIRAGILEQGLVGLLETVGAADRLHAEGEIHRGVDIAINGQSHRIDLTTAPGKGGVVCYGQTEVTRDLMNARRTSGLNTRYEAAAISLEGLEDPRPTVTYRQHGRECRLVCDFIAGCDGFHGVSRASIPPALRKEYERTYPFAWLGLLSDTQPASEELIYSATEQGFALASRRSATRARYYLQVPVGTSAANWRDEDFWRELKQRLPAASARALQTGPSLEKSVTPLRSFVCEPMQYGRLFLVGDAAHLVPPTGAKGLNLAAADVAVLGPLLIQALQERDPACLPAYSATALRRVWQGVRFSWWLTNLLHDFGDHEVNGLAAQTFRRMIAAERDFYLNHEAGRRVLAMQYVGLPYEDPLTQRTV